MARAPAKPQREQLQQAAREKREESLFLLVTAKTYRDFRTLASHPYRQDASRRRTLRPEVVSAEEELVATPKA